MKPKFRIFIKKEKRLISSEDIYQLLFDFNGDNICVTFEDGTDEWYEANEVALMQSTGVYDCSEPRKEIFEGDIVKTTRFIGRADETGGFYEFDKDFIGIAKQLEGAWVIDTSDDAVDLWSEIEENEIVGNIYQNPELVEHTKK